MTDERSAASGNGKTFGDDDLEEARDVGGRFLAAIRDHEPRAVWELMSEDARSYVLNLAVERGMDFDLGSALRQGTASDEDLDTYLEELTEGLRRDLKGVNLDNLLFEAEPHPHSIGHIRVTYLVEVEMAIGDVRPTIPAGSLDMVQDDEQWRVQRLVPKPG